MEEETTPDKATAATEETPETGEATATEEATAALLTADQVAERMGISTRRLRDWRKEGRIVEVGRFKRGTARIPLFDPAEVARLQRALAAEEAPEAPATAVAVVPGAAAFAEAVARQVAHLLAERAEAEAAAVAPLVALVRDQQQTIDDLRQRAELAEAEALRLREAAASAPQVQPAHAAPARPWWARIFGRE